MKKTLADLFRDFPFPFWGDLPDVPISGISDDTRTIKPGDVFVAIKGFTYDSHKLIPEALAKGAAAVVGSQFREELPAKELAVPYIRVDHSRKALAYLAAAFYAYPGRKLWMIGVTGTDGKTTTCNLIFHILKYAGYKVGMITTVNAVIGDRDFDTGFHVTTPGALEIQQYLFRMVEAGLTHCVLETTSHGWEQHRSDACEFDVGVFTNITHEHLDEHGNYENYLAMKARLLESLSMAKKNDRNPAATAVLNRDDRSYSLLVSIIKNMKNVKMLTYSLEKQAHLNATEVQNDPAGLHFKVEHGAQVYQVHSKLVGKFNVANCLAALCAVGPGLGINLNLAVDSIRSFRGVPGRMERIAMGQDFMAIVDFAHTPNALLNALHSVRELVTGRIITVFGSAGLRDKEKRRLMAAVSIELSDYTILTAEDPRTEDLNSILDEMASAAVDAGAVLDETFEVIADRGQAIRSAVKMAKPDDVVMVCGKGHEQSMCFGTIEYPWDDRIALRAALAELMSIPGPEMFTLPTSK